MLKKVTKRECLKCGGIAYFTKYRGEPEFCPMCGCSFEGGGIWQVDEDACIKEIRRGRMPERLFSITHESQMGLPRESVTLVRVTTVADALDRLGRVMGKQYCDYLVTLKIEICYDK